MNKLSALGPRLTATLNIPIVQHPSRGALLNDYIRNCSSESNIKQRTTIISKQRSYIYIFFFYKELGSIKNKYIYKHNWIKETWPTAIILVSDTTSLALKTLLSPSGSTEQHCHHINIEITWWNLMKNCTISRILQKWVRILMSILKFLHTKLMLAIRKTLLFDICLKYQKTREKNANCCLVFS